MAAAKTDDYKQIILRTRSTVDDDVRLAPAELRPRLMRLAEERDSNMTDVAVELLSEHYGIEYDLTGRRSAPGGPDPGQITLRLPVPLHRAIVAATRVPYPPISTRQEVVRVLCERLGIAGLPA